MLFAGPVWLSVPFVTPNFFIHPVNISLHLVPSHICISGWLKILHSCYVIIAPMIFEILLQEIYRDTHFLQRPYTPEIPKLLPDRFLPTLCLRSPHHPLKDTLHAYQRSTFASSSPVPAVVTLTRAETGTG